ncbi:MAG TPA: cytochrome c-type biogenesis protein [bacterium]|nr:cytochrome c-type biogenesis protein [bacterium]
MIRLVCALAAVCLLAAPAAAVPSLEDQVYAIARELMCPVCSGQTVAESNSQLAQQMRDEIRMRLQRGESREQIIAFFVGQFGESVLATPPRRGVGLLVWITPLIIFVLGAVILIRFLQNARRRSPDAGPDDESRVTSHESP